MWDALVADIKCKRFSHTIYSISDYENRIYWNRLPGQASVYYLPYLSPVRIDESSYVPYNERRIIACMPGNINTNRNKENAIFFIRFAEAMKAAGSRFKFVITGDISPSELPQSSAVTLSGMIKDVNSFLGQTRAIVILSSLGWGFKTTIADAIVAGACVIVHPAQLRRCSQPFCNALIPLNIKHVGRAGEIQRVHNQIDSFIPLAGIHTEIKMRVHSILARDFGNA